MNMKQQHENWGDGVSLFLLQHSQLLLLIDTHLFARFQFQKETKNIDNNETLAKIVAIKSDWMWFQVKETFQNISDSIELGFAWMTVRHITSQSTDSQEHLIWLDFSSPHLLLSFPDDSRGSCWSWNRMERKCCVCTVSPSLRRTSVLLFAFLHSCSCTHRLVTSMESAFVATLERNPSGW